MTPEQLTEADGLMMNAILLKQDADKAAARSAVATKRLFDFTKELQLQCEVDDLIDSYYLGYTP